MSERNNPHSLKVELDAESAAVKVIVREKVDGDFKEVDSSTFEMSGISSDILPQVELYGLSKLLQDRSSDVKAGPDKLAAMQEVFDQLAAGQWERERKAGAPTVSAEVEALAQIKGASVGDIQKSLRKFTKEQKETIFANEQIVTLAAQIRAAREANEVDLTDLI